MPKFRRIRIEGTGDKKQSMCRFPMLKVMDADTGDLIPCSNISFIGDEDGLLVAKLTVYIAEIDLTGDAEVEKRHFRTGEKK